MTSQKQIEAEATASAIAKAQAEAEAEATKAGIIIMAIGAHKFITKPDAKTLTGWSLAYINKLVNAVDNKPAQVNGIQMAGLGWLVDFHSLLTFKSTARRKQGLQSKRWQALEVFLSDTKALALLVADKNADATINAWLAIDASVTKAHNA